MRQYFALIVGLLLIPAIAQANVSGVELQVGKDKERIILHSDTQLSHKKLFLLTKPDRLVIDFPVINDSNLTLPNGYKSQSISAIRFGHFDAKTSRIVLDLNYPITVTGSYSVLSATAGAGWQYVLDIARQGTAPATTETAGAIPWPKPISTQETPVPSAVSPKPAAKKPLIVIDAGHGGQDPGAIGIKRTYEKHITLDYAKALRDVLLRSGRYRVLLTRENDRFIMLGERVNIARKAKADIFISLHADTNPRKDARGLSVYTLSETASDAEAAALAEQENKSDIIGGIDLPKVDEDVASILIDLVKRETMTKSDVLAEHVVDVMHKKITLLPNPHRYAGFRVLKAPDTPSILLEIGFLSNPQDEQLLSSKEFRGLFTSSTLKALDNHFADKRS